MDSRLTAAAAALAALIASPAASPALAAPIAFPFASPAASPARPDSPARPEGSAPLSGPARISADSLMASVRWLADDARRGRMTGSAGEEAAAEWIAERFARAGLEPAGDGGTYFQGYVATIGIEYGDDNRLVVEGLHGLGMFSVKHDFIPFGFSASGEIEANVVFAGYGITDEKTGYDDYAGIDAEGKIVLALRHEPQQKNPHSGFDGTGWSRHALFRTKAINAREHGAAGILLFTGPLSDAYEDDDLVRLSGDQGLGGSRILAAHIKSDIGEDFLETAGVDVEAWMRRVDETLEPNSFPLDDAVRVKMGISLVTERRPTQNVVARIPGRDPSAGAVLLGAHYDHLGVGRMGSLAPKTVGEIHNGADDNASGVAALVELARVLASGEPPERTVVFAAFSGEELGLLGSAHMTDAPPVPLDELQVMVNMDMIGRPQGNAVTVGGTGTSPEFDPLIDRLAEASPLDVKKDASGYGASDHTSFYAKDVPVLFFFSGLHSDYHRPSDDWDRIDREGFLEVTRMVHDAVVDLANRPERVEFARAAEDRDGPHGSGSPGRGYGPYLGTIPDFADREDPGVALTGVREGSPAEMAGIRGGDVVIRFAGREIGDLYDYTDALRSKEPGDAVEVVVLRDGGEVVLRAVLGRRE